jgi:D-alanyl-lipoteichoic acid acyltransferase DltB (MBOAT superfamily)
VLFPTITFALFFAVVLSANWILMRRPRRWLVFMLGASWFFYGWWDPRFVGLLVASSLGNHFLGSQIHRAVSQRGKRFGLRCAVVFNLGLLGFFKYCDFFLGSVEAGLRSLGLHAELPLLELVLPVGISFFTFQALSYVIDIYRGRLEPTSLLRFSVYLAFFPQLVAGPIVRASEFLPQLRRPRDPSKVDAARGFGLIGGGLFKKVVLADTLATRLVDPVFSAPTDFTSPEILLAVYGYAAQIYCDFSAYSDIAIGCALLMGFAFPDNFASPYLATSLRDFWRRWHMTLSRWLRDYLYIALGGSKRGGWLTYRNLMLTMLLGGLWHGASWMFVIWGALHGIGLAAERWLRERGSGLRSGAVSEVRGSAGRGRVRAGGAPSGGSHSWLRRWASRFAVFHFVCFAWIFFRSESMGAVGEVLRGLTADWSSVSIATPVLLTLVLGLGSQALSERSVQRVQAVFARLHPTLQGASLALFLFTIDLLGPEGVAAFIYFQF